MRVKTLKGALAGAYYTEELGGYYLDGGDPDGEWWGRGADIEFGLDGAVNPEAFLALMAGRDPRTGAQLGRAYGERSARGYDITFSAPKSVSVLWAIGDAETQHQVLAAHDAAVAAVLGYVERHAHVRPSVRGQVVVVDGRGLSVARFRQHTSRSLDPQLHTHAVVIAKVRAPNGGWYALDARLIKHDQRTLSALYHAGLRAELTRRLGVAWRDPVNGIAEMDAVPDEVLDHFSRRTADVEVRLQTKLDRFRRDLEREPNVRERWKLEREAVIDSRPPKRKGVAGSALHDTWRHELEQLGIERDDLVERAAGRVDVRPLRSVDLERASIFATADLIERQSSWRPTEFVGAVVRALPTTLGLDADEVVRTAEDVASRVVEERFVDLGPVPDPRIPVRRDGRPIIESALDRRVTLQTILEQEAALVAWAERRWARGGGSATLHAHEIDGLDRAQVEVAGAVAGTRPLVCLVGPAGAGKTAALRPAVRSLAQQGHGVFGVAPSATAAAVLSDATGMPADTLDKLLYEHTRPDRPPGQRYRLAPGATLVVDEASMVSTPALAALARLADVRQWRVLLIGDPHQLAAVGRAGMFAHLCAAGPTVELDRIHRFVAPWEREASRRLRSGDHDVLAVYEHHDRLCEGTRIDMERVALARWREATRRGERVLIVTPTNEAARRMSLTIQRERHDAGELGSRYLETSDHVRFFVGDRIVTRHNDRALRTDRGAMVRNRAEWTVVAMDQRHLTMTVRGVDGTVVLPPDYIDNFVELGYAQTVHAAQGRTVDRCVLLTDATLDGRGLYVGLTRGRLSNEALLVVDDDRAALDVLGEALSREWGDAPAIETAQELAPLGRDAVSLARSVGVEDAAERIAKRLARELRLDPPRVPTRSADHDLGLEL